MKYTIDNVSFSFSTSYSRSSDVTYKEKWSENYTGRFSYNLPFGRNNYIKPLTWTEDVPILGNSLSDFQLF